MLALIAVTFVDLCVTVFNFLILIRVVMSWLMPYPSGRFAETVISLTEPLLAPVRKLMPKSSALDISPIIVFIILAALQYAVHFLTGS